MNIERGFKRITFVVSVVVGLTAWAVASVLIFDEFAWRRDEHLSNEEKYENLKLFWDVWDANSWEAGQSETLYALFDSSYRGMRFNVDGRTFILYRDEVLPGVDLFDLLSQESQKVTSDPKINPQAVLRLADIPLALEETIQDARAHGLSKALANYLRTKTSWTRRTRPQLMALTVFFGLLVATGAIIVVWLSFFLLRWIGRGFSIPTDHAHDEESPNEVSSAEISSESEGIQSHTSTTADVVEAGTPKMTVR